MRIVIPKPGRARDEMAPVYPQKEILCGAGAIGTRSLFQNQRFANFWSVRTNNPGWKPVELPDANTLQALAVVITAAGGAVAAVVWSFRRKS